MVALIPARAGSKRCPGKNTRELAGHPLIAYTVAAARASNVFANIIVATNCWEVHQAVGSSTMVVVRSDESARDDAPDIAWVRELRDRGHLDGCDAFAILRPTSPFRTAATIRRAYNQFKRSEVHSLRAVQPVKEHPGKMWQIGFPGSPMKPLIDKAWPPYGHFQMVRNDDSTPWHSRPTQELPKVYVQNSSLEMAWTYVVSSFNSISGNKVAPFFTEGFEGFSIDYEDDFATAARLVAEGRVTLPHLPARTPDQPTAA